MIQKNIEFFFIGFVAIIIAILIFVGNYSQKSFYSNDLRYSVIAIYNNTTNQIENKPSGTGFYIGEGLFLTNRHVIERHNSPFVPISTFSKEQYIGEIVYKDDLSDIAIIKTALRDNSQIVPVRMSCNNASYRDEVIGIGNPEGLYFYTTKGLITDTAQMFDALGHEVHVVEMNIRHGMSGGPVFSKHNLVIGQIVALQQTRIQIMPPIGFGITSNGYGFVIPAEALCRAVTIYKSEE